MIEKNTLFILGAGASDAFGFPIGTELRDQLLYKICATNNYESNFKNDWRKKLNDLSFSYSLIDNLYEDLNNSESTIDEFTKSRKNAGEILLCKYLIADILSSIKFDYSYCAIQKTHNDENDPWFGYLIKQMKTENEIDFRKNRVKFLTFNYDLSLEECFHLGLKSAYHGYGQSSVQDIFHVFGKIKAHDGHDNQKGLDFDYSNDAENMMLFHEPNNQKEKILELTSWADEIVFLGFGFHESNINLLGMKQWKENIKIYSTAFSLSNLGIEKNK